MFRKIQQIAETGTGEPIDSTMVGEAVHILKTATAVGIDLWSPADLRKLLSKAFQQLAATLQQ
eukprot:11300478-Karenia_brevis.AAC.1